MVVIKAIETLKGKMPKEAFERIRGLIPLAAFTGGFAWDSMTLTRVDNLLDNAILFGYLILLGLSITMMYLFEEGKLDGHMKRLGGWYPSLIQFFMGGLFSSYVVFYFHSASMSRTLLFVIVLAALLVANEFLKGRLNNIYLTMGLYYFVAFSFFAFAIPVVLRTMSYYTFLASGIVSLALVGAMAAYLYKRSALKRRQEMWSIISQSVLILIALNVLYTLNWIPPVPLSVKHSGIYHDIQKDNDKYILSRVKPSWYEFWRTSDTYFRMREGDTVYCFSSIFAPAEMQKGVFHHWSYFDMKKNQWAETDKIGFEITGGRGQGWRGYTYKRFAKPGRWKVDIRTEEGLMLGRIAFRVVETPGKELELITDKY